MFRLCLFEFLVNSGLFLASPPIALALPADGPQSCQPYEDTVRFAISDRHLGSAGHLAADDITVQGTVLSTITVWGFYLDRDPDSQTWPPDCGPFVPSD